MDLPGEVDLRLRVGGAAAVTLGRQTLAALHAPAREDLAAVLAGHAAAEAVGAGALEAAGLERTFHGGFLALDGGCFRKLRVTTDRLVTGQPSRALHKGLMTGDRTVRCLLAGRGVYQRCSRRERTPPMTHAKTSAAPRRPHRPAAQRAKQVLASVLTAAAIGLAAPAIATAQGAMVASTTADSAETETAMLPERHGAWTEILAEYVRPGAGGVNLFDYGGLQSNSEDRAALQAYIASFETLDFSALTRDEAYAAWANLYNAVTIEHILGRYPVKSIRSGYIVGPWKEVKVIADGREVSLDDIEHKILRVEWSDPRVHYAVNCASIGCPNLGTRAWEAATLDADLDIAARAFINDPRGVTVMNNGLKVSRIYKWFREDFGGTNAGVIDHLREFAEPDLLAAINASPRIRRHAYDWSLNDIEG